MVIYLPLINRLLNISALTACYEMLWVCFIPDLYLSIGVEVDKIDPITMPNSSSRGTSERHVFEWQINTRVLPAQWITNRHLELIMFLFSIKWFLKLTI